MQDLYVYIFVNVNELNSFSSPDLEVVACSLLHCKPPSPLPLAQKFITLFSVIVGDMYSLRVSAANLYAYNLESRFHVSFRVEV